MVKSILTRNNYQVKYSTPSQDGVITVCAAGAAGTRPLDQLYDLAYALLLFLVSLNNWARNKGA